MVTLLTSNMRVAVLRIKLKAIKLVFTDSLLIMNN